MASSHFKKIFFIRFLAYFALITGFLAVSFEFGPVISAEVGYRKNIVFGVSHKLPPVVTTSAGTQELGSKGEVIEASASSSLSQVSQSNELLIKPVSTDFGIVIEKINANALVVADVDPANEKQYVQALAKGVAAAQGSTKPGEAGNLFIFSHSTDAPWNIIRFNAIFYLLREVQVEDKINIFYQGRRYIYVVFDQTIASPKDVSFLTNRYDKPVLTLQTCDPPGTVANRLIVRAQLMGS